ncbi:interferon gamma related [Garra rufa]|uniref:interferon gamma related n=1 Tax=Garra rufa TaxID=137080 RepID=UPI003CCE86C9
MDSWLNMLLLCGLLLIASLQTTNAFRFRRSKSDKIPKMLSTNIHNLQTHYNTKGQESIGKSLFVSHLDQLKSKGSCTCQALLLEAMLKTYEDIFQDMLNKSEEKEVKANLMDVMTEVHKLKHKYNEEQKVWRELQDIHSVKVKNGTIQEGALNDFIMVFTRAYTEKTHDKAQ